MSKQKYRLKISHRGDVMMQKFNNDLTYLIGTLFSFKMHVIMTCGNFP